MCAHETFAAQLDAQAIRWRADAVRHRQTATRLDKDANDKIRLARRYRNNCRHNTTPDTT